MAVQSTTAESADDIEAPLLPNDEGNGWGRRGRFRRGGAGRKGRTKSGEARDDDADNDQEERPRAPEESASMFSHVFFSYCTPLLKVGVTKPLDVEDVWPVPLKNDATATSKSFMEVLEETKSEKYPQGRVRVALIRAYGMPFLVAGIVKVFHDCLSFTQPIILSQVLNHLSVTEEQLATSPSGFATDNF